MLNLKSALRLAESELNKSRASAPDYEYVIVEWIAKPYGWVFFYNTRKYHLTRDTQYGIIGNGPIIVLQENGKIIQLRSSISPEQEIADWEAANLII